MFTFQYIAIDTEAGVTPEEFETFVRGEGVHLPVYPGWRWTLLRGLRGERTGQYLMLYEIESAEQRDLYVTARGEQTEAGPAVLGAAPGGGGGAGAVAAAGHVR